MGMSISHLLVILIIILLLFGAGKLPQVMSDIGKGLKAFKNSLKDEDKKDDNNHNKS
jgi:sec-independent protein translocase protein TatA